MVELIFLSIFVACSFVAAFFSTLAIGLAAYVFIRVRAWEKTETKLIPVPSDTNGMEKFEKAMKQFTGGMDADLAATGFSPAGHFDPDDLS